MDTNVLVSGLLNPNGPPGQILDLILSGDLELLMNDRILAEYREEAENVLAFVEHTATWITTLPLRLELLPIVSKSLQYPLLSLLTLFFWGHWALFHGHCS